MSANEEDDKNAAEENRDRNRPKRSCARKSYSEILEEKYYKKKKVEVHRHSFFDYDDSDDDDLEPVQEKNQKEDSEDSDDQYMDSEDRKKAAVEKRKKLREQKEEKLQKKKEWKSFWKDFYSKQLEEKRAARRQTKFDSTKKKASETRLRDIRKRGREQEQSLENSTPRRRKNRLTRRSVALWAAAPPQKPRKRAASEPRNLGRVDQLVPKTSGSSVAGQSKYLAAMEKTVELMSFNIRKTAEFFQKAASIADSEDRKFSNFCDPFQIIQRIRLKCMRKIWDWKEPTLGADYLLDLDPTDSIEKLHSWKRSFAFSRPSISDPAHFISELPEVKLLQEDFQFKSIGDLQIPITDYSHLYMSTKVDFATRTFILLIKTWQRRHPAAKLPRLVHYFLFAVENKCDPQLHISEELLRDALFWLPIHLGDVQDGLHAPNENVLELAIQMARVLLNDWPLLTREVPAEELQLLLRLEAATMRMECSLTRFEMWIERHPIDNEKFWKRGLVANMQEQVRIVPEIEKSSRRVLKRSNSACF